MKQQAERRRIPAMGVLLESDDFQRLQQMYGRELVRVQTRMELDGWRAANETENGGLEVENLAAKVRARLEALGLGPLRRVLNATGVFLHTNLGRSPLPREHLRRAFSLLSAASDVELDLVAGERGNRNARFSVLLAQMVAAPATLVTNNNAAALVLALAAHAHGKEVLISRGELVEIGGSFRLPEILSTAGARLREVGTTNRTRLQDYAAAISEHTGMILRVHPSNFRVRGFVESAPIEGLVELAARHSTLVMVDEGSGLLLPHRAPQLANETCVRAYLASGCDLVCCSTDKLLGGPQGGLLMGRRELVEACGRHPLYRALRPGRLVLTMLDSALRALLIGEAKLLDGLWPDVEGSRARLEAMAKRIDGRLVEAEAFVGGGAAPDEAIGGWALRIEGGDRLHERLRRGDPAVFAYRRDGGVILDLRTVDPSDDDELAGAVNAAQECSLHGSAP